MPNVLSKKIDAAVRRPLARAYPTTLGEVWTSEPWASLSLEGFFDDADFFYAVQGLNGQANRVVGGVQTLKLTLDNGQLLFFAHIIGDGLQIFQVLQDFFACRLDFFGEVEFEDYRVNQSYKKGT